MDYNGAADVQTYLRLHRPEQERYLKLSRVRVTRGRTACDIGCGGGAFLDRLKDSGFMTMGVEPFLRYHRSLKNRGHQVFASTEALLSKLGPGCSDLVVSFHVIEHVEDPIRFLEAARSVLRPGGRAVLATPNSGDILMKLGPEAYRSFNYRTAHRWYFNAQSLKYAAQQAGFVKMNIGYSHNYDLSNFALWLREGRPTGNAAVGLFGSEINRAWRTYLERNGMADTIVLYLKK